MLRIKDWDKHFENHRTRELKSLDRVQMPNKHDGEGYAILVGEHEKGFAHFAAWVVLVQMASKCSPRGTLVRSDGTAMDAAAFARKSRMPAWVFDEAIPRLLSIEWLEEVPVQGAPAAIPRDAAEKRGEGAAIPRDAAEERDVDAPRTPARTRADWIGEDRRGEEGERLRAPARAPRVSQGAEPGGSAPQTPAPPGEASARDGEGTTGASTDAQRAVRRHLGAAVQSEWEAAASRAAKLPGKTRFRDAVEIGESIPDPAKRAAVFETVFAEDEPKAMRFVAEDLAKWTGRARTGKSTSGHGAAFDARLAYLLKTFEGVTP